MSQGTTRGVTKNQDLDPSLIERDTRSWRHKLSGFAANQGSGFVMVGLGGMVTLFPILGMIAQASLAAVLMEPLIIIGLIFWLYARKKGTTLQYRSPSTKLSNGQVDGDGIIFVGNDLTSNAEVWFSNDDFRTHMLVFGSTGSGKTRFLLGLLYQALLVGSGCLYTDGKGDNTVWWLVFSFCRRVGREDDLLVMNYLTGGDTGEGDPDDNSLSRLSNTNNPFAFGNSDQLRSLIVGLMRDAGGDGDMWKGMASAMMGGLLKCLVYMRDTGEINLDVSTIREHLPLDQIVRLSMRPELPDSALAPIKKYLQELPGYVEEEAILGRINPKVYEQHGYRIMQFSEVLADLEDTYGHIFSAPLGEVDFKDVVFNRRILFVMLPALEKDPDALAGLGKMVVAGVRAALGPALGNKLEGLKSEVVDQKPTNSNVPFLMILDEYGYYSVKGFAVVAAQARSLGVSVIFAGQDYPSFKKGSEEEAQATIANTNIKIGMKVEEDETAKILIDRAAEADVTVLEGSERYSGVLNDYKESDRVKVERRNRINYRDMVQQKPGQAHVMFGDELARCQLFYAEPHEVEKAYLNKFVMIDFPEKAKIDSLNGTFDKLNELMEKSKEESKDEKPVATDQGLKTLISDFKFATERNEDSLTAAITATGLVEWRAQHKDMDLKDKSDVANNISTKEDVVKAEDKVEKAPAVSEKPRSESAEETSIKEEVKEPSIEKMDIDDFEAIVGDESPSKEPESEPEKEAQEIPEVLATVEDREAPQESVKDMAEKNRDIYEKILGNSVLDGIERTGTILSPAEKKRAKPRNTLAQIEMMAGATEEEAQESAESSIDFLSQRSSRYPTEPRPEKRPAEDHLNKIAEIIKAVDVEAED